MIRALVIVAGIALSCSGPVREVLTEPTDKCKPTETRCNGSLAEICDADERWAPNMNCAWVSDKTPFICCATDNGHTCLLECTL